MIEPNRYVVFRRKDAEAGLTVKEQQQLSELLDKIASHREAVGKPRNTTYLVVSTKAKYAKAVKELLIEDINNGKS